MTMTSLTIGERIKLRREELRMSQDELAQRLGYKSRSSINKIELGGRNLTQSKIKAIADALSTTPSYIMGWNTDESGMSQHIEKPFETSSDEQTMIKKYRCLDDNGKTMIDGALDNLYQKTIQSRIKDESAG